MIVGTNVPTIISLAVVPTTLVGTAISTIIVGTITLGTKISLAVVPITFLWTAVQMSFLKISQFKYKTLSLDFVGSEGVPLGWYY